MVEGTGRATSAFQGRALPSAPGSQCGSEAYLSATSGSGLMDGTTPVQDPQTIPQRTTLWLELAALPEDDPTSPQSAAGPAPGGGPGVQDPV